MHRQRRPLRWGVGLGAVLTLILIVSVALWQRPSAPRVPATLPEGDLDLDAVALPVPKDVVHSAPHAEEYVGGRSCADCHRNLAARQRQTAHEQAARLASVPVDGAYFRLRSHLRDGDLMATYTPAVDANRLLIENECSGVSTRTYVHLAVGSGRHGVTYLSLREDGSSLVPPISVFFADRRARWIWSPGVRDDKGLRDPLGRTLSPAGTAQCVGCHSTSIQGRLVPARDRLGIGCERCHGPAARHLRAATTDLTGVASGRAPTEIPSLRRLSARQVLALCNTCHRPLGKQTAGGLPEDLARAQPVALAMSPCFRKSGGQLSCVTCHDPHGPLDREAGHYERVCLGCHSPQRATAVVCPVNRSSGCVGCHMAREEMRVFNETVFTNHWIRRRPSHPGALDRPR